MCAPTGSMQRARRTNTQLFAARQTKVIAHALETLARRSVDADAHTSAIARCNRVTSRQSFHH